MIDALIDVLDSLSRNRLRTLATAFGVFWGIFMVTLLLAGGSGLRNGLKQMFAGDAVNAVWIDGGHTSQPYEGLGAGRTIALDTGDLEALRTSVPDLENLSPRHPLPDATTLTYGTRSVSTPVLGIHPGFALAERARVVAGRALDDLDVREARKVVVVGERAATLLFEGEPPVGKTLNIGGAAFLVVGVFTDSGGDQETQRVFIPYSALASVFDPSGRVTMLIATLRESASPEQARARVLRILATRHRFQASDAAAVSLWFMTDEYRKMSMLMRGIDLAILVVGLGTLISGMIGVSNILFVSVRERAPEFGLRRALGATAGSVLRGVLAEAVLLALAAGSVGLLCGTALIRLAREAELQSEYFDSPQVDVDTALLALGALVITSLVAGYFPAREAARLPPIDALRRA